jgi:DNA-binding GntR family transcriptional regulator
MTLLEGKRPIIRRLLHEELVEHIRSLITSGEIPPGEKIPERELCDRFGVSRTPLREALKLLASEGLVTLTPNRGASVSSLTVTELEDAFPVMGALEALSGEIACRRVTDAEIDRIRSLHEKMVGHWKRAELAAYFRLNQQIHEAILDATRNATLKSHYRSLSGRILSARYVANLSPERWQKAVAEHGEILAALEARDGERLAGLLKSHLAGKLETIKERLEAAERAR